MTVLGEARAWAPLLLLVGACSASMGPAKATEGETDLSCAGSIFAATNLLDSDGIPTEEMKLGNYVAVMTKYGTAYAKSDGIGANEAFSKIKIEAYRMTGIIGAAVGKCRSRKSSAVPRSARVRKPEKASNSSSVSAPNLTLLGAEQLRLQAQRRRPGVGGGAVFGR